MNSQPLNILLYQLDWPPERVPPLIELVYFFAIQAVAAESLATPKNSAAF
jgi:hypothetical protein